MSTAAPFLRCGFLRFLAETFIEAAQGSGTVPNIIAISSLSSGDLH